MGRRHSVSSSEMTCRAGLLDKTLERPVETFTCELSDERIDKGQLATEEDDGHIGA